MNTFNLGNRKTFLPPPVKTSDFLPTTARSDRETIGGVIGGKMIEHLKENSISKVSFQLFEIGGGLMLAWVLIDPHGGISAAVSIASAGGYALPKIVGAFAAVKSRKACWRACKRAARYARRRSVKAEKIICGIPASELVDYLVRNKHFRREGANGVRETFGLGMQTFNSLAATLEDAEILERGENNGRVLGERWSRQALADFFNQKSGLRSWLRVRGGEKIRLDSDEIKKNFI